MTVQNENNPLYAPLYEIIPNVPEHVEVVAESFGLGYLNILPFFGEMIELALLGKNGDQGRIFGKLEMLTAKGELILSHCCAIVFYNTWSEKEFPVGIVKVPHQHLCSIYWEAPKDSDSSGTDSDSGSQSNTQQQ
ncbi:uncharacterized protein LOC111082301 [Drosophila obscura]|uniref:uncharacterized protein LOC111082301 n=1 Tax=Drosophila obscura TaxID=7282 RepID=UPI000BA0B905|nr:uncharacterized protein LOC111082301 [Drosophila obscura]XP_022234187.1 uncharacterized protein LOC111082301 [Drosophila obscura]